MSRFPALASSAVVLLLAVTLAPLTPAAQQQLPAARPQAPATKGPLPAAKDAAAPSDSGLRQRVEQLEEQLMDMQVMVGTLESLAKGTPTGSAPSMRGGAGAALDAAEAGRLDGLETQIRALAAQLEQLQDQVRALGGRSGSLSPTLGPSTGPATSVAGGEPAAPAKGPRQAMAGATQTDQGSGFGSLTVSQDGADAGAQKDEINRLLTNEGGPGGPAGTGGTHVAGLQQGGDADSDPKKQYSTAYGYLIQRDYGAAEAAFEEFLRQNPNHPLAGNALYWMGESLYVRGQYRAAASAFLKGYQQYARSEKAPESLLKLAMSLQRLGQKDAACSSFNELNTKFPNAPARVKSTAQSERQRVGC